MITRMVGLVMRMLLAGLTLSAGWVTAHRLVAMEIADRAPGVEGANLALEWDSSNPEFLVRRARLLQTELEYFDLPSARADWEQALQLHPDYWLYWLEYGRHLEMAGRPTEAEKSFLRAIRLSPYNGRYRWELANFYLRQGAWQKALSPLQEALDLEDTFLDSAALLLLVTRSSRDVVERIWPARPTAVRKFFHFLVRYWDRAESVWGDDILQQWWQRLVSLESGVDLSPVHFEGFLNQLLLRNRLQTARRAWVQVMERQGMATKEFAAGREFVWNGDFENRTHYEPFGWQIRETNAFEIRSAPLEGVSNSTALRLRFRGRDNPHFENLRQTLVLEPGKAYRLTFSAKVRHLLSESGFYWALRDLRGGWEKRGGSIHRAPKWRAFSEVIFVPPETELVELSLQGLPSDRAMDRLATELWIDEVSLRPAAE